MNPAACARAKKAERLAREASLAPAEPRPDRPPTREEAYRTYRKHTRPFRSAFRGIISRREAERFIIDRVRRQRELLLAAQEQEPA